MAEYTFYPDAHPEVSSVDGTTISSLVRVTWQTLIASPGTLSQDSFDSNVTIFINAGSIEDTWDILDRGILLFDTSAIPPTAAITKARLALYGHLKSDTILCAPDFNIYSSNPASETGLVPGDFGSLGSTPLCDTPLAYADFNDNGWNYWEFNAAGLAAITKGGITKLGTRNANYDVAGVAPLWRDGKTAQMRTWGAEKGGDYRPKLVVNYGTIYPSDPATRVTELVHRYTTANVPSNKSLTLEVLLGGATFGSITVLSQRPPTDPELIPVPPSAIPIPPPPDALLQDPFAEPVFEPVLIGYDPATGKAQWLMPDGTIVLRDPDEQPPRAGGRGPARAI